jgi:hypothetical protein
MFEGKPRTYPKVEHLEGRLAKGNTLTFNEHSKFSDANSFITFGAGPTIQVLHSRVGSLTVSR